MKKQELDILDKYFRTANYISACQLYLLDNPLLKRPLSFDDIKKKIVGHWGTVPGQNFIWTHLNRIINKYDLNMIYLSGPGHGGNFFVANAYIEGSYTEKYPSITMNESGLKKLFKQFSFPGGIPSHVAPETPGSIHEGGELGYSLAHAFGAVLDNPNLIATCVIGDGEAETGPLATSWHGIKFLNRKSDGVVLPILHLNGYKISNPTLFSRMTDEELGSFFYGCGYKAYIVSGSDSMIMHKKMAQTLDLVVEDIKKLKSGLDVRYPMIILKTPKGWTGPKEVDGKKIEGSFASHQVPITISDENHLKLLEEWLLSYRPSELFDNDGHILAETLSLCPKGDKRMASNPNTNGGLLKKDLVLPNYLDYGVLVEPCITKCQDMLVLSSYLRDVFKLNDTNKNFRLFGPDETMSNRLYNLFDFTDRDWQLSILPNDEHLSKNGRIMDSMLSEHMCEGLLEGYLLTGRHGIFVSYEAFIKVVDSMVSQHAKWLKVSNEIPWRLSIASLNLILTSNVWQQDHNGYTHQDPGFIDQLITKKSSIVRVYLPADANTLVACVDSVLRSNDKINVIVASKHPSVQWLTMEEAKDHFKRGISIWPMIGDDNNPDLVIASCGDTPTKEAIAACIILKQYLPNLKIRFINVVDLMKIDSVIQYPNALSDSEYDNLFTKDKPIIFAYHGYRPLIYELTYYRHNHNMHVHGYIEEGTITTPFDMCVKNELDRFHLVMDAVNNLNLGLEGEKIINDMNNLLIKHKDYIKEYGIDMEEVRNFEYKF